MKNSIYLENGKWLFAIQGTYFLLGSSFATDFMIFINGDNFYNALPFLVSGVLKEQGVNALTWI